MHRLVRRYDLARGLAQSCLPKTAVRAAPFASDSAAPYHDPDDRQTGGDRRNPKAWMFVSGIFVSFTAYAVYSDWKRRNWMTVQTENKHEEKMLEPGVFKKGLKQYSMEEVAKHSSKDTRLWVVYRHGVYDITDFVDEHPGGDKVLLGAGSSIEPFWHLYAVHKTEETYALLEEMRIGNLNDEDVIPYEELDPYATDPVRSKILRSVSLKPFNAESPGHVIVQSFLTPNDAFYVRNHLSVPVVDLAEYELNVEIEGLKEHLNLNLDELKEKFPKHTITATVMCAGNRRRDMSKVKLVKGLEWTVGAVGNATWTGVKLRDVLLAAGLKEDATTLKHVQFEGLDTDLENSPYSTSITLRKAMDPNGDVILAYEMNGEPLMRDHGFPLRAIVPGVVGARNVKWLGKIYVSKNESPSHWQQNDYKGFSPSIDWNKVDYTKSPAIQELPVISAICVPEPSENVKVINGHVEMKGYAWSGNGCKIIRIDVTADEGKTWHVAEIDQQDGSEAPTHWCWTLWSAKIPVPPNATKVELWAKAVDSSYNSQPESFENIWNLRGVLNNAYHRVPINLKR